jgi:hypothetical protein
LPVSRRLRKCCGLRPHAQLPSPYRLRRFSHARAICRMRHLFDGSSELPSSRERNMVKSILAKPLDPDRMIAIVIAHEEAYDVYEPGVARPRQGARSCGANVEEPGNRQDEDANLVLTCSPRRPSERGSLPTRRSHRAGVHTQPCQTLPSLRSRRCQQHQLRFLQEGLTTPMRGITGTRLAGITP